MPISDSDMARLRAEMLLRAEQLPRNANAEQPVYDDGASLLGQDPYMQQVSLFGRGPKPTKPVVPVNPSRRSFFGLPEASPAQPLVPVTPTSPAAQPQTATPPPVTAPQPAAQPQPTNPLGQIAAKALNAPVSRRQVLQRAGAAAVQSALPTPKATDIIKEVVSPLAEAAMAPAATPTLPTAALSLFKDALLDHLDYKASDRVYTDALASMIRKQLTQVDAAKLSDEQRNDITTLLQKYRAAAKADFDAADDTYRDTLFNTLSTVVDALPENTLIKQTAQSRALDDNYEFLDTLKKEGKSEADIRRTLKELKIRFDRDDLNDYFSGGD